MSPERLSNSFSQFASTITSQVRIDLKDHVKAFAENDVDGPLLLLLTADDLQLLGVTSQPEVRASPEGKLKLRPPRPRALTLPGGPRNSTRAP